MSGVELSLAVAALLIGLTGAWSPCGFSMVETIGLSGDGARRWTTIASCATFAPGAVLGGVATFGMLSALGELVHGVGGEVAYAVAATIAVAAAVAEARGTRIVPQIRRQLPERWRWTMPMPLAAALYGVLLGLGFTTFVLSFGVWALAGIGFALGDPYMGLVIGAAFGIGRAMPVVLVAPAVDSSLGVRCVELMAERPALYRLFRLGDAVTLGIVAVALTATGSATAARTDVPTGADPSAAGKALAYQRLDRGGILRVRGQSSRLPGRDPAIGGSYAAVIFGGDQIRILDRFNRKLLGSAGAPGVKAVAISRGVARLPDGQPWTLRAEGSPDQASRESRPGEADRRRLEPGSDRPSEHRRPPRLLRGLEARRELDQAAQPSDRQATHGGPFPDRGALESGSVRKTPPLRAGEARSPWTAGDQGAEASPKPDAEADRPQGARAQNLFAQQGSRPLVHVALGAARLRHLDRAWRAEDRLGQALAQARGRRFTGKLRWRQHLRRYVSDADGAIEGRARLDDQPAPVLVSQVDQVVLHRGLAVAGEVGHGGGHHAGP